MTFSLANYLHVLFGVGPRVDFETYFTYVPDGDRPADHPLGGGAYAFFDRPDIPFVLRSHAPYRKGRFSGRVILVLRDPRDVLVSHFHYMTKNERVTAADFQTFLQGNLEMAAVGVPSALHALSRYLDSWVRPALGGEVTVTTYEQWRASPEQGLSQLVRAVGLSVDADVVAAACARSDQISMRRYEAQADVPLGATRHAPEGSDPNSFFVRRGEVGGWRSELDEVQQAELCRLLEKWLTPRTKHMLRHAGLPCDFR